METIKAIGDFFNWDPVLWGTMLCRVFFAAVCGGMIGYERDCHGRAAGFRTHTLVASGAAMFTMASFICADCPLPCSAHDILHGDVERIAAQVVSGIGFLGAGTIVKEGFTVKGLTTAACLWLAAAMGMCCAMNCIPIALVVTSGSLVVIFQGKKWEHKLHKLFPFQLIVDVKDITVINDIKKIINRPEEGCVITTLNLEINKTDVNPNGGVVYFYVDANSRTNQIDD